MIGICSDANEVISTGHIMRCIAIAEQLKILDQDYVFICFSIFTVDFLKKKGYNCVCLNSNWTDIDKLSIYIKSKCIGKLIIDSYEITATDLSKINEFTKVIYLDDLNQFECDVSTIINYGINVTYNDYEHYLNRKIVFLLGKRYTPLRKEFLNKQAKINEVVANVFVTTGGSDSYCFIEKMIKSIFTLPMYSDIKFHVIVGDFFNNKKILTALAQNNKQIILYKNVKDMAKIMCKCDVAISAGGTTLAELCACGLPTICFAIADNQIRGIESYANNNIMISIGDIRVNLGESINKIHLELNNLIADKELRSTISKRERSFIDGYGARRIAEHIVNL